MGDPAAYLSELENDGVKKPPLMSSIS